MSHWKIEKNLILRLTSGIFGTETPIITNLIANYSVTESTDVLGQFFIFKHFIP